MNRNQEDIQFATRLKAEGYQASENQWFTRRVLNQLPERHRSSRWIWGIVCLVAAVLCVGCWLWQFSGQTHGVITVRDLVHYTAIAVITAIALWQGVATALSGE